MTSPSIEDLQRVLGTEDPYFSAWARTVPDRHWAKLDLSAVRIGYELGKSVAAVKESTIGLRHRVRALDGTTGPWIAGPAPAATFASLRVDIDAVEHSFGELP